MLTKDEDMNSENNTFSESLFDEPKDSCNYQHIHDQTSLTAIEVAEALKPILEDPSKRRLRKTANLTL